MREYKFKANRFGCIWKVIQIDFICPEKGYDFLLEDFAGKQIREWGKNLDLMQYTGLKDKNCVDIYEGDIVRYVYYQGFDGKEKEVIAKVEFRQGCFGFLEYEHGNLHDEDYDCYFNMEWDTDNIEVIGNIYENPELLPEKV